MSWDEAVVRYSRLVISVPMRLGLDRADCEDVLQRTWAVALRRRAAPLPADEMPRWLGGIAYWVARDVRRARRPASLGENAAGSVPDGRQQAPPELASRLEREQIVREALDQLSPADRRVLTELFLSHEPSDYAASAQRLGVAATGIGARRGRALARLRAALERRGVFS